jgi:hypothetical protein
MELKEHPVLSKIIPPLSSDDLQRLIKDRLEFQNIFNAKVIFFVLDKETKTIYYQYLENLNSKKSNPSSTGNRIIYPVENFLILKRPEELMKFLT